MSDTTETVPSSADMVQQELRLHLSKYHRRLRFWSFGEHRADHQAHHEGKAHAITREHTHAPPTQKVP